MTDKEWEEYRRQANNDEAPEVGSGHVLALLAERDDLKERIHELITWIDERKFEQIHKYCGCTYCRARVAIGKQS